MARFSIRPRSRLATIDVLAPERYDPRRALDPGGAGTARLGDLAAVVREVVQPAGDLGPCLVLDTSDAREGLIIARKPTVDGSALGSAKKLAQPRDVLISRLRPYLRQVAYVDEQVPNARGARLACSTEFFVLRPRDAGSIAFLVPLLLSRPVQEVLAAAQEGGHHPRFDEATLLTLPVPVSFLDRREAIAQVVEQAVARYRESERQLDAMVAAAEGAFSA